MSSMVTVSPWCSLVSVTKQSPWDSVSVKPLGGPPATSCSGGSERNCQKVYNIGGSVTAHEPKLLDLLSHSFPQLITQSTVLLPRAPWVANPNLPRAVHTPPSRT